MFLKNYFTKISELLNEIDIGKILELKKKLLLTKKKNGKVIMIGNGGSISTCAHFSVDLTKNAKIKSVNFNEANLITCFSNDYGFENWLKKALIYYAEKSDLIMFLSVSGESKNLVNALTYCIKNNIDAVTLTGMSKNNKLCRINKNGLNFNVNSSSYNLVEILHHITLLSTIDLVIGRENYGSNL